MCTTVCAPLTTCVRIAHPTSVWCGVYKRAARVARHTRTVRPARRRAVRARKGAPNVVSPEPGRGKRPAPFPEVDHATRERSRLQRERPASEGLGTLAAMATSLLRLGLESGAAALGRALAGTSRHHSLGGRASAALHAPRANRTLAPSGAWGATGLVRDNPANGSARAATNHDIRHRPRRAGGTRQLARRTASTLRRRASNAASGFGLHSGRAVQVENWTTSAQF